MTDDRELIPVEDPPEPDLADLQQRDLPVPSVPVDVQGAVRVHLVPNRVGNAYTVPLGSTAAQALSQDIKRSRATLIATVGWSYRPNKSSGQECPIPANVPITVCHAGEVWVNKTSGQSDGTLTVITETYAD